MSKLAKEVRVDRGDTSTNRPPPIKCKVSSAKRDDNPPHPLHLDERGYVEKSALNQGCLYMFKEGVVTTNTQTHKHTNTDTTHTTHTRIQLTNSLRRLSPELYDNIIRLPIPIRSGVLMMLGVLPVYPSSHGSFVGGWNLKQYTVAKEICHWIVVVLK
jgi:hypothetical protein